MGAFDNATMVKINNKEVDSIKTNDGGIIYQRPIIATITDSVIQLGVGDLQWLITNGNVTVDWGDGTTSIVNNPTAELTHSYTDNKESHNIAFLGTVTGIGDICFDSTALTSITIPNSITSFGRFCFYGCSSLTNITIPNSVTNLGDGCFRNCDNLNTYQLYWTNNNIITYYNDKMPNNTNTKFYVPKGQKTNYVNKGYPSDKIVERSS